MLLKITVKTIYLELLFQKKHVKQNKEIILKEELEKIVFLWNKKIPVNEASFHIIKEDMKKLFEKAGLL